MRATIRDQETLKTIRPLELVGYLRAQGWRQISEIDEKSSLWEVPAGTTIMRTKRSSCLYNTRQEISLSA